MFSDIINKTVAQMPAGNKQFGKMAGRCPFNGNDTYLWHQTL